MATHSSSHLYVDSSKLTNDHGQSRNMIVNASIPKTWQEWKPFLFSPGDVYLEQAFNILTQKNKPFNGRELQVEAARQHNNELYVFFESCEKTQDSAY